MKRRFRTVSLLILLLSSHLAVAHKASDSYLSVEVENGAIEVYWDIALRDLEYAIGLDGDDDGGITWHELRGRHDAVSAYALAHLKVKADEVLCVSGQIEHLVNQHSDGAYAVLHMTLECPAGFHALQFSYSLFFDLDPLHRGLFKLKHAGETQTAVLSPAQPFFRADFKTVSLWREFAQFVTEGVWHIGFGFDHILFLMCVLLPAVLIREKNRWLPVAGFEHACWGVVKIVTAFTVAHSVTLSLATLGIVSIPSRWVESVIAASVILAALNNLKPIFHERLWWMVFAFGLVHGFGFASVLLDLGLTDRSFLINLLGFNVGVELGQLLLVSVFLPLAFLMRHSWVYEYLFFKLGSLLIIGIASMWFIERAFNVDLN